MRVRGKRGAERDSFQKKGCELFQPSNESVSRLIFPHFFPLRTTCLSPSLLVSSLGRYQQAAAAAARAISACTYPGERALARSFASAAAAAKKARAFVALSLLWRRRNCRRRRRIITFIPSEFAQHPPPGAWPLPPPKLLLPAPTPRINPGTRRTPSSSPLTAYPAAPSLPPRRSRSRLSTSGPSCPATSSSPPSASPRASPT